MDALARCAFEGVGTARVAPALVAGDTSWVGYAAAAFFVLIAWIARPRTRGATAAKRPPRRFEEHLEPLRGTFGTAAGAEELVTFLRNHGFIAIARVAAGATLRGMKYEVVVAKHELAAVETLLDEHPPDSATGLDIDADVEAGGDDEADDDVDDSDDAPEPDRLLSGRTVDAVAERVFAWRTWFWVALGIAGIELVRRRFF